jgi:phosphate-selective porin OprO and OprP
MGTRRTIGAAVAVAAALCVLSLDVRADNQALLRLLDVLYENGTIDGDAYAALREAAGGNDDPGGGKSGDRDAAVSTAGVDAGSRPGDVEFAGRGVRVDSPDRDFRFVLGGQLSADAAHYREDLSSLGSGTEMRRVRLTWDATLSSDWVLKGALELAGGADLRSTYIEYVGFPNSSYQFGKFKEPVSLEEISSSKYSTFMERGLPNDLVPGRNVGIGGQHYGDGWGVSGGLFAGGEDGDDERDEGLALTGRLHFAPKPGPDRSRHIGVSASHRALGDSRSIRFRARPESHVTGVRLVDTGLMEGVENVTWLGLEAALVAGPFSLQSEYLSVGLERSGGRPDLRFDGWYAYTSWFLTGESRNYDAANGRFGRVSPRRSLGQGGPGAIELGLRFSRLNLTDEEIIGGSQDNLTFGLNWYPTPNVRFMANYVKVLDLDRPASDFDGDRPSVIQIRGQADF